MAINDSNIPHVRGGVSANTYEEEMAAQAAKAQAVAEAAEETQQQEAEETQETETPRKTYEEGVADGFIHGQAAAEAQFQQLRMIADPHGWYKSIPKEDRSKTVKALYAASSFDKFCRDVGGVAVSVAILYTAGAGIRRLFGYGGRNSDPVIAATPATEETIAEEVVV